MELSRRLARGRMAELMGQSAVASDLAQFRTGYSDEELTRQVNQLRPETQAMFRAYVQGVNDEMERRKRTGTLPAGYRQYGFEPEPWTLLDSAAIGVRLARLFGNGGAGELRNTLLLRYLQGQPNSKDNALAVINDLAWFNDRTSPTTLRPENEPKSTPNILPPSMETTRKHIAALPPSNVIELAPVIQVATAEPTRILAEATGVFSKTGSYAIAVSPSRSANRQPMLLGAPQMGHTVPSVVHEMSIRTPEFSVTGMNVPGIPGVLIGSNPDFAWTFTSGVADVADVFFNLKSGTDRYQFGQETRPIRRSSRMIKVRGGEDVRAERQRTTWGPVVLDSRAGNALYSVASGFWNQELHGIEVVYDMYRAKTGRDVMRSSLFSPLSFNLFFAARNGDIGWRYFGNVPMRSPNWDPRFPTPGQPENRWRGFIPPQQMPAVLNPESGLVTNWNNKPARWWPNFDTPVWGRFFRVDALNQSLSSGRLTDSDLAQAAWRIARRNEGSWTTFLPFARAGLLRASLSPEERLASQWLLSYDGWNLDGSKSALVYQAWISELRKELLVPTTGGFLSPGNLDLVAQTSVLANALERRTQVNYLGERAAPEVALAAFRRAVKTLQAREPDLNKWRFRAGSFRAPEGPNVLYGDRGTYIQIVRFSPGAWSGRSVLGPGNAEEGPHSSDQTRLNRQWEYKPMIRPQTAPN